VIGLSRHARANIRCASAAMNRVAGGRVMDLVPCAEVPRQPLFARWASWLASRSIQAMECCFSQALGKGLNLGCRSYRHIGCAKWSSNHAGVRGLAGRVRCSRHGSGGCGLHCGQCQVGLPIEAFMLPSDAVAFVARRAACDPDSVYEVCNADGSAVSPQLEAMVALAVSRA
jgi:hypothetical protein